jgi:CDGSH-type Zn-finger protein
MLHRSVHYNAREDMTLIELRILPDGRDRREGHVTTPDRGSSLPLCRSGRAAGMPFCARAGWKEQA